MLLLDAHCRLKAVFSLLSKFCFMEPLFACLCLPSKFHRLEPIFCLLPKHDAPIAGQDCQMVDTGRCGVREGDPTHSYRQDLQAAAAKGFQTLQIPLQQAVIQVQLYLKLLHENKL